MLGRGSPNPHSFGCLLARVAWLLPVLLASLDGSNLRLLVADLTATVPVASLEAHEALPNRRATAQQGGSRGTCHTTGLLDVPRKRRERVHSLQHASNGLDCGSCVWFEARDDVLRLCAGTDDPEADGLASLQLQSHDSVDDCVPHRRAVLRLALLDYAECRGSVYLLVCQQPLQGEWRLHAAGHPDHLSHLKSHDYRFGTGELKHPFDFSPVEFSTDDSDSGAHWFTPSSILQRPRGTSRKARGLRFGTGAR